MTTQRLKPTPYAVRCRCGAQLPKGATAKWDAKDRLWYDCYICRKREQGDENAASR